MKWNKFWRFHYTVHTNTSRRLILIQIKSKLKVEWKPWRRHSRCQQRAERLKCCGTGYNYEHLMLYGDFFSSDLSLKGTLQKQTSVYVNGSRLSSSALLSFYSENPPHRYHTFPRARVTLYCPPNSSCVCVCFGRVSVCLKEEYFVCVCVCVLCVTLERPPHCYFEGGCLSQTANAGEAGSRKIEVGKFAGERAR